MEHIIDKLHELKENLNQLQNLNYSEGNEDYESTRQLLERIIDRTYPEKDAQDLKRKLTVVSGLVATSSGISEPEHQNRYLEGISKAIRVIDTIVIEYELFGFDDFKPVKEKVETEVTFGVKNIASFSKKKTK